MAAALTDLDFVSERAPRHEDVVEELLEQGTVEPMKPVTLFLHDAAALAALGEQRAGLEAAYHRFASLSREAFEREEGSESGALVDAGLLAADERDQELHHLLGLKAASLKHAGATLSLTGPWPAHHFIALGA